MLEHGRCERCGARTSCPDVVNLLGFVATYQDVYYCPLCVPLGGLEDFDPRQYPTLRRCTSCTLLECGNRRATWLDSWNLYRPTRDVRPGWMEFLEDIYEGIDTLFWRSIRGGEREGTVRVRRFPARPDGDNVAPLIFSEDEIQRVTSGADVAPPTRVIPPGKLACHCNHCGG